MFTAQCLSIYIYIYRYTKNFVIQKEAPFPDTERTKIARVLPIASLLNVVVAISFRAGGA